MAGARTCIDANIVVRLIADPADRAVADLWAEWDQEGIVPAAPSLILYEVANALYRYEKMRWLGSEATEQALDAALALPIEICEEKRLYQAAMRVSRQFGLSAAYDGHYLALAQLLDADFWTTDRRLFNSVQHDFPKIHLVEN